MEMRFIIRTETATHCSEVRCSPREVPLKEFAGYVREAVERGFERVSLIRVYTNGQEVVLNSWVRDDVEGEREIFKYKIHSLRTATKGGKNQGNDVFYGTADEALVAATKYVTHNSNPQPMVIYKAIKIVRPADRPAVVEDVD